MRLHEVVALLAGAKPRTQKRVSELYKLVQKPELFDGLERVYQPAEDGGEQLPPETKRPQLRVQAVLTEMLEMWGRHVSLANTLDAGNREAAGDIIVAGVTVAHNVPIPTLLMLEKQLTDVRTFIEALPTPDPAEQWELDPAQDMLATRQVTTARTRKVQRPLVLYPATPEHPAQTQIIQEDVLAGYWNSRKYTTRLTRGEQAAMLARVEALIDAVKTARERANSVNVEMGTLGSLLLSYIRGA